MKKHQYGLIFLSMQSSALEEPYGVCEKHPNITWIDNDGSNYTYARCQRKLERDEMAKNCSCIDAYMSGIVIILCHSCSVMTCPHDVLNCITFCKMSICLSDLVLLSFYVMIKGRLLTLKYKKGN